MFPQVGGSHNRVPLSACRERPYGRVSLHSGGVGKLLGYARVSTLEQNAALQADALTAAGCWRVFTGHVSGAKAERPELGRVLEEPRAAPELSGQGSACLG